MFAFALSAAVTSLANLATGRLNGAYVLYVPASVAAVI
jgi:hypothetical protein